MVRWVLCALFRFDGHVCSFKGLEVVHKYFPKDLIAIGTVSKLYGHFVYVLHGNMAISVNSSKCYGHFYGYRVS